MRKKTEPLVLSALITLLSGAAAYAQQEPINYTTLSLDVLLIIIGLIAVYFGATALKGKIGNGLKIASAGLAILGFLHLLETMLFAYGVDTDLNETTHRILVFIGFALVAYGLYRIRAAVRQ